MDFLFDPTLWVGLLTLVVLEIVLGIDNLVFVAILAKKLPPADQNKALYTGLGLALVMRLALLSIMSWLVSLTTPLFTLFSHVFSARDLILLGGGLFLLFKATMELHERLEARPHSEGAKSAAAGFWIVIVQILLLDAVFSLDSIITAVGMVNDLGVMMTAVVAAMIVMIAASRPLTTFVNQHPTVVVLCLSFLLMIGCSLVAEGLGFHIPKGYLYAAIAFSILIEFFNQVARRNTRRLAMSMPFRERTTSAIVRLMSPAASSEESAESTQKADAVDGGERHQGGSVENAGFGPDEQSMVKGVLTLADRSIRMIMTPRSEIGWLNLNKSFPEILADAQTLRHSLFPVGDGSLDRLVGFVKAKDLIGLAPDKAALKQLAESRRPFMVPETISVIRLVRDIKRERASLVIVTDEFGVVQGLVTSHDVLEAIAGDFPDEGDRAMLQRSGDGWMADGSADLIYLEQVLGLEGFVRKDQNFVTIAGFLLDRFARLPKPGDVLEENGWRFEVAAVEKNRIETVLISRMAGGIDSPAEEVAS